LILSLSPGIMIWTPLNDDDIRRIFGLTAW
jgi:hypothetical protein